MNSTFIAYYRVSRKSQRIDGLGMAAQKQAVTDYVTRCGGELIAEFKEIESGKRSDRPELVKAMDRCRLTGAKLVIAKLDRLSRNVHFLSGLMERKVAFVACDMPDANELTVHIMVAVAQQERQANSARTKAALAEINAKVNRGEEHVSRSGRVVVKLGNPRGLTVSRPDLGTAANQRRANDWAMTVLPSIQEAQEGGATTLAAIASWLNERRILTARKASWTPTAVKRVIDRADKRS